MNDLMKIDEVLRTLRISRSTLNKLVKQGKIKVAIRIGSRQDRRFKMEDIEKFIKEAENH